MTTSPSRPARILIDPPEERGYRPKKIVEEPTQPPTGRPGMSSPEPEPTDVSPQAAGDDSATE
ncbi:MAG: hypothetical protein JWN52_4474 [Actinomycetia bacterium]|nr:hypothetical protein [Actinomycetes bacterium]